MKLTGADIVIECLREQNVDTIFGFPGGAVLNIYDSLYKKGEGIRHILTSHEQGAAHAADGYARATGKPGVCIATSGPGATNLVTGIATAYMDSIPLVAITGQVPSTLIGRDSFQEVDITGITEPITKHNFLVKDVNRLAETMRMAFEIATTGRPGPVLVDICKDVTADETEFIPFDGRKRLNLDIKDLYTEKDLDEAAYAIQNAKKPVILAGGGTIIAGITDLVLELSEKMMIPVSTTLMGTSAIPSSYPLYTGLLGMHGTRVSNKAVSECDLLINIGARFSDRVISDMKRFAPYAKIMHIDADPAEINKNISVHYPLTGNTDKIMKGIIERLKKVERSEWAEQVLKWKDEYRLVIPDNGQLKPSYIIKKFSEMVPDAYVTTEVGQNQIWAAQYFDYKFPRQYISSGGLGTMGYGTGAAIGIQLAKPGRKVINFAGDGSFRMNCNELATAVYYKLPIVIALLNNGTLGMVRQWQTMFYGGRHSQSTLDRGPDFVKLAEAYGAIGIRVTKKEEVVPAIEKALSQDSVPVVIDFIIDIDERVLPIVPPGKGIDQLIYT
ncbi:acetolactate synthase large subunit IlvB [Thermoclostridium stercorarium subsp. stercorarium DSM 8532]|uniref:Acetolactate synthase n=3 Tax=Thermoclostridium stercorarium TaxID=1510 RepID=L7VS18_THES1|nr:biosynthetic-type acetolactate synthase large subunit [Thermoclostridium stercorarium]AGC68373.1 acetolactate synthase large subunit IlvB [Thermoclostridium stercorarium subsp. stercorarium DSM 8532]ANW98713.1 acetolactate synthase catalytic subunit [Thermoclostridium stercorarium subsp. thermolacticum DSM 2910]ANX01254.1 acetolactate synthase catalytic subunit [Thermoclostridium stercorarium subsp. leptospartum DSM 9219]UZQ86880.1 biosynthetic-type acetolactate synthase large subunit [Therm